MQSARVLQNQQNGTLVQKPYCVTVGRLGLWDSGAETVLRYCRKAGKSNERGQPVIHRRFEGMTSFFLA